MKDLMNLIHLVPAIAPQVLATGDTPFVSAIIDLQGFDSATFVIQTGTLADVDATVVALVDEGDAANLSDAAAAADGDLIGTEVLAGLTFADDGECRKVGYRGSKRYIRLTMTPANNAGAIPLSAVCILGNPSQLATASPPQ